MPRPRTFGAIKASDCRMFVVRLPDVVCKKIKVIGNGLSIAKFLTEYALSVADYKDAQLSKKCIVCKKRFYGAKTKKYCSQSCKSKLKRAKKLVLIAHQEEDTK